MIVVADVTNSPTAVGRSLTKPENGARMTVSVRACWAVPTCVCEASTASGVRGRFQLLAGAVHAGPSGVASGPVLLISNHRHITRLNKVAVTLLIGFSLPQLGEVLFVNSVRRADLGDRRGI